MVKHHPRSYLGCFRQRIKDNYDLSEQQSTIEHAYTQDRLNEASKSLDILIFCNRRGRLPKG
jgi:hypothetical protein